MSTEPRERDFTPAAPQLWLYDFLVKVLTREGRWRGALIDQIRPSPSEVIADVGCGTGSNLVALANRAPGVRLIGIDPDPAVRERAQRKLDAARVSAELRHGYARETAALLAGSGVRKLVSSLVFHQVPMDEKRAGLLAFRAALPPGGELHVADYGLQRTRLMRRLFRIVQEGDGYENTEPNAQGVLPELMREAGFADVRETQVIPTPSGSISLYFASV